MQADECRVPLPPFPRQSSSVLLRYLTAANTHVVWQVRAKIVCGEYDMPDVLFQHVSSDAKDFISKLLVVDQEKRMSAEQALAHPWLRRPTRCVPVPFDI